MKWLKNILVVIALLVTALPCTHADVHPDVAEPVRAELGVADHCSCHACEHTVCTEDLEVQQNLAFVPGLILYPASEYILLVLVEEKPVFRPHTHAVYDPLIGLQTIQLLI